MGCCCSAGGRNLEAEHGGGSIDGEPPTSPPGIVEVEAVKEVLLETPVKAMPPENQEFKAQVRTAAASNGNPGKDSGEAVTEVSEITEVSVCSYSESLSTAAEKGGEVDVDDGVVDQRPPPKKRRASGGGRGRGERVVARRTAAPAPEKRGQVRGRAMAAQPRNAAEGNGNGKRKDLLEGSRRRSRSPVRREDAAPPRNETDKNIPAAATPPNGGAVAEEEVETLENPVVSLECFIFL